MGNTEGNEWTGGAHIGLPAGHQIQGQQGAVFLVDVWTDVIEFGYESVFD